MSSSHYYQNTEVIMYDSFYRVYGVNWRYSRHERRSLQRARNMMCPNPTANPVSDAEATSYFLTFSELYLDTSEAKEKLLCSFPEASFVLG